jgi:hypothetical protein
MDNIKNFGNTLVAALPVALMFASFHLVAVVQQALS